MAATQTTEARELALLDKVELRIALADTDTKLQTILNTYLPPILLKLSSEHVTVRNKVISICQHVNTRVKPENIQLPVETLLKQFKEHRNTPLIRHFDLLYVQQGIERISTSALADLFPTLVAGIAEDASVSAQHGAIIFNLLLRSLKFYQIPPRGGPEDAALRKSLGVSEVDTRFLAQWFTKLFLLRPGSTVATASTESDANQPGISKDELAFLTLHGKPDAWNSIKISGLNITEAKSKAIALLASGLFISNERLVPVLFASADPVSRISEPAEDLLKRITPEVSLEDADLVSQLFLFYTGNSLAQFPNTINVVPPVRLPIRTKILNLLSKSTESTKSPAIIVAIVQRDLLQEQSVAGSEEVSRTDRESLKLKSSIIAFLRFVARQAAKSDLEVMARSVISSLKTFNEHQQDDSSSIESRNVRTSSYEIIGQLASAHKVVLFESNMSLLKWLFQSLSEEGDRDVLASIDEALALTITSFRNVDDSEAGQTLREILLRAMLVDTKNGRNVRYAAVRFANRCLAYNDVIARWIDILALGFSTAESQETVEEAKKGLDPYWYRVIHSFDDLHMINQAEEKELQARKSGFPSFISLVSYLLSQAATESNIEIRSLAVTYCRQALIWESLTTQNHAIELDASWERKMDLAASQDESARHAIRSHLNILASTESGFTALNMLWRSALTGLMIDDLATRTTCARVFVELCVLSPEPVSKHMSSTITSLEAIILGNDLELRSLGSQAYGILSSNAECDAITLERSVSSLLAITAGWKGAAGSYANKVHGALLSVAALVSHRRYRLEDDQLSARALASLLPTLLHILDEAADAQISQAAFTALGQLCCYYALNLQQIESILSYEKVIERIKKWAKAGNEKAIIALGKISMILHETNDQKPLDMDVETIYDLHEIRQAETQFAVGEALTYVASGWSSKALLLDIHGPAPKGPERRETLGALLTRILEDSKKTKPSLKKASVIWLLCFVQFCGETAEVQSQLRHMQAAFRNCLADRDELISEAAARGLGLVYDKGSKDIKDALVSDLVGSFSSDRASLAGTVTDDTQLFEAGALPTGEGSSVTTYKDIMSLASEVGDSSLTYRFMALASNNAIWSSRAAFGRFGLSNVLSTSGYLTENPKLYPKLFRYRFDPNTNARRSMNDIWNALVKDSTATVNAHFSLIIEDLLLNMVGKEWRTRQASCAALADLIQGRRLEIIEPYLERLWTMCFKVLDDIKETVRAAAAGLSRVLIGILIRSLEAAEGSMKGASKMLKTVLPFLLSTNGIESSAKEVQTISIHSLLEIIKKGRGPVLRPFVPELVESLLGLLTSLEPQAINYIHMNADKHGLTENAIDKMREASIRGSPLMDAIERCLDLLDEATMQELVPSLQKAMRSAVGMPSKVGCSRVLVSLSTRRSFLFKPHCDLFMKMIQKYMGDRNESVSSAYATALGYVARASSNQAILDSATHARNLYFDADDLRPRLMSGEMVRAVGKYATDRFAALASAFLPLVYIGRHDSDEQVKSIFQEVWTDNTGGSRAVSLYLSEIVTLASGKLTSQRWTLKHAAALSITDATQAVATSQGQITDTVGDILWPALEKALAEKSWDGKEIVLKGFVAFVKSGTRYWSARLDVREGIKKIAKREAGRRNAAYRTFAIDTLSEIAKALNDNSFADAAMDIVRTLIDELVQQASSESSTDGTEDQNSRKGKGESSDIANDRGGTAGSDNEPSLKKSFDHALEALFRLVTITGKDDENDNTSRASPVRTTTHDDRTTQKRISSSGSGGDIRAVVSTANGSDSSNDKTTYPTNSNNSDQASAVDSPPEIKRLIVILELACSLVSDSATLSISVRLALAPAVWRGTQRLLAAASASPAFTRDILHNQELGHPLHAFLLNCAHLLLPVSFPGSAAAGAGTDEQRAVGQTPSGIGLQTGAGNHTSSLDSATLFSHLPEVLRLQQSEGLVSLSRAIIAHTEACVPRCRDYPLGDYIEHISLLVSSERSPAVRRDLALAIQVVQDGEVRNDRR